MNGCRRRRARNACLTAIPVLALTGCVVQSSFLREDWQTADRLTLKRVAVLVTVPVGTPPVVAELCGRIARRYVNLKKDYLVLRNHVADEPGGGEPVPEVTAGVDGLLVIDLTEVQPDADDLEIAVDARLLRMGSKVLVWQVVARRTDEPVNEDLERLTKRYERELGPECAAYVAPIFILLKKVFDDLPSPLLTDDDIEEKIFLDD